MNHMILYILFRDIHSKLNINNTNDSANESVYYSAFAIEIGK